jgi:hypothetical protein
VALRVVITPIYSECINDRNYTSSFDSSLTHCKRNYMMGLSNVRLYLDCGCPVSLLLHFSMITLYRSVIREGFVTD